MVSAVDWPTYKIVLPAQVSLHGLHGRQPSHMELLNIVWFWGSIQGCTGWMLSSLICVYLISVECCRLLNEYHSTSCVSLMITQKCSGVNLTWTMLRTCIAFEDSSIFRVWERPLVKLEFLSLDPYTLMHMLWSQCRGARHKRISMSCWTANLAGLVISRLRERPCLKK